MHHREVLFSDDDIFLCHTRRGKFVFGGKEKSACLTVEAARQVDISVFRGKQMPQGVFEKGSRGVDAEISGLVDYKVILILIYYRVVQIGGGLHDISRFVFDLVVELKNGVGRDHFSVQSDLSAINAAAPLFERAVGETAGEIACQLLTGAAPVAGGADYPLIEISAVLHFFIIHDFPQTDSGRVLPAR